MTTEIVIPFALKSLNVLRGMHFHAYKHYRNGLEKHLLQYKKNQHKGRVSIELYRVCSGVGLDHDGLVGSGKPLLDACQNAGIIRNDDEGTIVDQKYENVKIGRKQPAMTVLKITDVN